MARETEKRICKYCGKEYNAYYKEQTTCHLCGKLIDECIISTDLGWLNGKEKEEWFKSYIEDERDAYIERMDRKARGY
jgi:hypothetical protein